MNKLSDIFVLRNGNKRIHRIGDKWVENYPITTNKDISVEVKPTRRTVVDDYPLSEVFSSGKAFGKTVTGRKQDDIWGRYVPCYPDNTTTYPMITPGNVSYNSYMSVMYREWESIVCGTYGFFAVSKNSKYYIHTSTVSSWSIGTFNSKQEWSGVAYGNDHYIAICENSDKSWYSYRNNWSFSDSYLPAVDKWKSIVYGDKFVVIANQSVNCAVSEDGFTWSLGTLPSAQKWISVAYGNGKYVAIAEDSNVAAYSTDGLSWTVTTLPEIKSWKKIVFGNGRFMAVGGNMAIFSTDAINWSYKTLPASLNNCTTVVYGNEEFRVFSGTVGSWGVSSNGNNWTTYGSAPIRTKWKDGAYGYGCFMIIGDRWTAYSTANNGWLAVLVKSNVSWGNIAYFNNKYIAVSNNDDVVAYSTDGTEWTQSRLPDVGYWSGIAYGNNTFVVTGWNSSGGVAAYSTDGINWFRSNNMIHSQVVVFAFNKFYALHDGALYYSSDGNNWSRQTLSIGSGSWSDIVYANGKIIIAGYARQDLLYSSDGVNWYKGSFGTYYPNSGWRIDGGDGIFVAVCDSIIRYSYDGITWSSPSGTGLTASWKDVTYGDNGFIAIAGTYSACSSDGVNWKTYTISSYSMDRITYGNTYLAISGGGYQSSINITPAGSKAVRDTVTDTRGYLSVLKKFSVESGMNGTDIQPVEYIGEIEPSENSLTVRVGSNGYILNITNWTLTAQSGTIGPDSPYSKLLPEILQCNLGIITHDSDGLHYDGEQTINLGGPGVISQSVTISEVLPSENSYVDTQTGEKMCDWKIIWYDGSQTIPGEYISQTGDLTPGQIVAYELSSPETETIEIEPFIIPMDFRTYILSTAFADSTSGYVQASYGGEETD